jgi:hypothetical protein
MRRFEKTRRCYQLAWALLSAANSGDYGRNITEISLQSDGYKLQITVIKILCRIAAKSCASNGYEVRGGGKTVIRYRPGSGVIDFGCGARSND